MDSSIIHLDLNFNSNNFNFNNFNFNHKPQGPHLDVRIAERMSQSNNRIFNPHEYTRQPRGVTILPQGITEFSEPDGITRLRVRETDGTVRVQHSSLFVSIDGACPGNGTPHARASFGVYFGPQSYYNEAYRIPGDEPQTNQYAELSAAAAALESLWDKNILQRFGSTLVVLMTDSSYLTKGISEWIWNWEENGFLNSSGGPVVNAGVFQWLHNRILAHLKDGVEIKFWNVPRELNGEADRLANLALNLQGPH